MAKNGCSIQTRKRERWERSNYRQKAKAPYLSAQHPGIALRLGIGKEFAENKKKSYLNEEKKK